MFNVHPSLLPRWRGAAPIERAIEAGDETTGVTIMRPTAELDAGPTCVQRAEPIRADDDYGTLSDRLAALGGELLVEALDDPPPWREQPEQGVTYAEKIETADRRLDPGCPAEELERRIRALTPHMGAYLELPSGERLGVRRAALRREAPSSRRAPSRADGERLLLGTASGALELLEVQPPGGRPMDAADYLRGPAGRHLRLRPRRADTVVGTRDVRGRRRNRPCRAAVPCLRGARPARHQPAGPLPLRELPAPLRAAGRRARTAARTRRSPGCPTPRTWTECRSCGDLHPMLLEAI